MASLDILENAGIYVPMKEALECWQEMEHRLTLRRIPPSVVMDYMGKAAREFTLYSRNPKFNMIHKPGNMGQRRDASLSDLEKLVNIADTLDNFSVVSRNTRSRRQRGAALARKGDEDAYILNGNGNVTFRRFPGCDCDTRQVVMFCLRTPET